MQKCNTITEGFVLYPGHLHIQKILYMVCMTRSHIKVYSICMHKSFLIFFFSTYINLIKSKIGYIYHFQWQKRKDSAHGTFYILSGNPVFWIQFQERFSELFVCNIYCHPASPVLLFKSKGRLYICQEGALPSNSDEIAFSRFMNNKQCLYSWISVRTRWHDSDLNKKETAGWTDKIKTK